MYNVFFFFQAEDGIRGAQESRWLGYVYKRQRGGTGVKRIYDVSASSAPFISNYNVSYLNAPGGTQTFAQVGSTNYNILIDWQVTGKDLNSVSQDLSLIHI